MKKVSMITLVISLIISTTAFGYNSPVEFLNEVSSFYKDIQKRTWKYTSAIAKDKNARKIDRRRSKLIDEYKEAISTVKGLDGYNGDNTVNKAVLEYLELNLKVLNEEYSEIVDLEEIAEESYDNMEAYLKVQQEANEKMNNASETLQEKIKAFGDENNVTIEEDDDSRMAQKLKKAGEMWKYYNEVYLIFFKPFKQEAFMLEAMEKSDLAATEQNRESMITYSKEGLNLLKEKKAFNGDNSLVEEANSMLNFFIEEGEKHIPVLLDFYIKKDHFESVSSSFESLKKKERTKEKVDEYNKAVKEYNEAIKDFNNVNDDLNKSRSKALDSWNKTTSKFTSKNI